MFASSRCRLAIEQLRIQLNTEDRTKKLIQLTSHALYQSQHYADHTYSVGQHAYWLQSNDVLVQTTLNFTPQLTAACESSVVKLQANTR
jgi:hypothetical protein